MRNYRLYLQDIFTASVDAQEFIEGMNFEAFAADKKTIAAVIRQIEIIGEATKNVPAAIRQTYPQVPWSDMARMRDKLIHGYFDVDISIVWETVTDTARIPLVQSLIAQVLKDMEAAEAGG